MSTLATYTTGIKFNVTTPLMSQQTAAVEKMLPTRIGALFMEMGTGKSLTAIELARLRQERIRNVIWFSPVSCKETVRHEILKHTNCPDSQVNVFDDRTNERNLPDAFWHCIGIESMSSSDRVVLTANKLITPDSMVICDESSYIKGHTSSRTQRITKLAERAQYRQLLTGTPLSQGIEDLYSQMRFLSPQILGYRSFYSFAANHLEYSDKFPGMIVRSHNLEYIAAKIAPYVYQVTKDECLDLPEKLYETRYFKMTSEQRAWYETAKEEILSEVDEDNFDGYTIFRLFSALQSITSGFWNRKIKPLPSRGEVGGSRVRGGFEGDGCKHIEFNHNRVDLLMDTVLSIPQNEKIILWCKYQHDIRQIGEALNRKFGPDATSLFHGDLNEKQRKREREKFSYESRFFLATEDCGGHGLTLVEAAYAVVYNDQFKYSTRLQYEDRNHRIGQIRKSVYIDLHCMSSIDDRIAASRASKGNTVEAFKREVEKVKGKKAKLKDLVMSL
jgi:SNF2 family DNA or RNA helicase